MADKDQWQIAMEKLEALGQRLLSPDSLDAMLSHEFRDAERVLHNAAITVGRPRCAVAHFLELHLSDVITNLAPEEIAQLSDSGAPSIWAQYMHQLGTNLKNISQFFVQEPKAETFLEWMAVLTDEYQAVIGKINRVTA
ncbi:hypothetical protein ACFL04_00860 [Patescibacteria group bacterium]